MTEPIRIDDHAFDNLRYIRETMERAGSFTSIPGWGGLAIGGTAVVTSIVASRLVDLRWLEAWLIEAVVAAAIALITMSMKAARAGVTMTSTAARRFFVSYFAPIIAAAVITMMLARAQWFDAMPAVWLLSYGASFISSGSYSIRVVPQMGVCFMLLGAIASLVSFPIANALLGVGFGGLHIIFGLIIARNYGG
ncbi:MAG TPA: hypothetical protein VJ032_03550 [Thermoanaerobaculia bacterium]|nr:hypothetical protein [Thermoanaerobaculia bacterium]